MIVWKYGIRSFRRNPILYLLIALQFTVVIFLVVHSAYTFNLRFKYFTAFYDELSGDGLLVNSMGLENNGKFVVDRQELFTMFECVDDVYASYTVTCGYEDKLCKNVAYDDAVITAFTPDMYSGSWLTDNMDGDVLEIVVSQNDFGLETGDTITLNATLVDSSEKAYEARVIGVLADNAAVYLGDSASSNDDYRKIFNNYSYEYEESMLVLMSKTQVDKLEIGSFMSGNVMISYGQITSQQKDENYKIIQSQEYIDYVGEFDVIFENSKKLIISDMAEFVPIIIAMLVLIIITALKVANINMSFAARNYAIYYLLGLSPAKCNAINVVHNMMPFVLALVINICIWPVLILSGKYMYDVRFVYYAVATLAIIFILFFIIIKNHQRRMMNKIVHSKIVVNDYTI